MFMVNINAKEFRRGAELIKNFIKVGVDKHHFSP